MIVIYYDEERKCAVVGKGPHDAVDKESILAEAKWIDDRILWPDVEQCRTRATEILNEVANEDEPETAWDALKISKVLHALVQFAPCDNAAIFRANYDELLADGRLKLE